jgi:hypothetical protein
MQLDAENIRTNSGHRSGIVHMLQRQQKAFDHVNWAKLTQILKGAGIDWHKKH